MTMLELRGDVAPPPEAAAAAPTLHLQVDDILASGKRLWVRGRLAFASEGSALAGLGARWRPWGRSGNGPLPEVHLETRLHGRTCASDVRLQADNNFEALFEAELPPARRGWRVAHSDVTCAEQSAEQSSVVLLPPRGARAAVVVVLPLAYSTDAASAQHFAESFEARGLAAVLRRWHDPQGSVRPIYYLAGVAAPREVGQAGLALAAASLGWPQGPFVLLPAAGDAYPEAVRTALDRLRWLFAGTLELTVLNLEPRATEVLSAHCTPADDRAAVTELIQPGEDPWSVVAVPRRPEPPSGPLILRPRRSGLVTKHPLVFCHGMLALSTLRMQLSEELNCFYPLRDTLRARGFTAYFPNVAPTSGVKARAVQLREQIRHWTKDKINLIAHSMGGLDARWLITHLDMADHVASLTTIATPHHGTFLAEWFEGMYRHRLPLLLAMEAMGINVDGIRDCQRDACAAFNEATPNVPGVRYFSYGGAVGPARVTPALRRGLNLLTPVEGPNDGLVSLHSARWGEYLGTLQADHYAQTPDAVFVRPGEDFDSLRFYSRLVEDLARRGF